MQLSNVVITPLGGRRVSYQAPASASLTVGEIVALTVSAAVEEGLLALVDSARLVRGSPDTSEGELQVLSRYTRAGQLEPIGPLVYAPLYVQPPPPTVLQAFFSAAPRVKTDDGRNLEQSLSVGALLQDSRVAVAFAGSAFARHTAWLATSGSGKSYSLGVVIEELLLRTSSRLLVFDLNGDFSRLREGRDDAPWRDTDRKVFGEEIARVKRLIPARISDIESAVGEMCAGRSRGTIVALDEIEAVLWQEMVAAALKKLWNARAQRKVTIIIVDEAHNLIGPASAGPAADAVSQIAGEGRKYGLALLIASQRPQKIDANVLTQCDNLILMKLTSRSDVSFVASQFNAASEAMIALAYGFATGEALVAGRLVPAPTLFKFRRRNTHEGGADIPVDWIQRGS